MKGKVVSQQDIQGWRGMSQQSVEFKEKYGYYPLWTNSMFSGMPAYQIAFDCTYKLQVGYLVPCFNTWLAQADKFFLSCLHLLLFFLPCCRSQSMGKYYGRACLCLLHFDPIIINVGHNTEMVSIGYVPAVLAGLLLLFQRRYWAGFAVTAFFRSVADRAKPCANGVLHFDNGIGIMAVAFLIKSYKEKQLPAAIKGVGTCAGSRFAWACLQCGDPCCQLMNMQKKVRVAADLNLHKMIIHPTKPKADLIKKKLSDGAMDWVKLLRLFLPDLYGGGSRNNELNSSSKFAEKLTEAGVPEDNAVQNANDSSYWGDQPSTAGPVYLGAIICFLFIFGLFYVKSWHKWWIIAATAFAILLAWGANLKGINYFIFDHLPFYNKFRAVTMSLNSTVLFFGFGSIGMDKLITETDYE